MIKFFIKSFVLLVLIFLVLQEVDKFFYSDYSYRDTIENFTNNNSKEDLSIAFFGNSHSYSSFNPRIFEDELEVNALNMGGSAQRLVATKVVADLVLNSTDLDLAVVNIFKVSLNEPDNDDLKVLFLNTIDFLPPTIEKVKFITTMFSVDEWPEAFSETIRYHSNWFNLKEVNKPFPYKNNQDYFKGFNTYRVSFDSTVYSNFKKKYEKQNTVTTQLSTKQKNRIDDLISLFEKNQTPLIFVNAPSYIYDVSVAHRTFSQVVENYLKSRNVKYIEFNKIKNNLGLDSIHYRNPNHLNTKGSIIVSKYLINFIKDSLDIKFKKKSIELMGNRYSIISQKTNDTLFSKRFDSVITGKLFGINEAILYNIKDNKYEFIFPLEGDTIGKQPFRLEHDVTRDEVIKYLSQKVIISEDSTKVIFYGNFSNMDVLTYKNRNFVVFPFQTPLKKLNNVSFHGGNKRMTTAFRIDSLKLK